MRLKWIRASISLLAVLGVCAPARAQMPESRNSTIAGLESLVDGTAPRHGRYGEHGEGQRLQWEVDAAFESGDEDIIRLAQRAATRLIAFTATPIGTPADPPTVSVESVPALRLPRAVPYAADIFASVDGAPMIHAGRLTSDDATGTRLQIKDLPRAAGLYRVRIQAQITYGSELPPERRRLPDVFYAVYDPQRGLRPDIAALVLGPAMLSAQQLDRNLPDVPLVDWIDALTRQYRRESHEPLWRSVHCPRGPIVVEFSPTTGDICVQGYLEFGLLWIRTGRIEPTSEGAQWIAVKPEVLAIQVATPAASTEVYALSELPGVLGSDPSAWAWWDVSLAPEDIIAVRTGLGAAATLDVAATVRNAGGVDARGVLVTLMTSNSGRMHWFFVDVPRRGHVTVKFNEPMPMHFGALVITAEAGLEVSPLHGREDPTPDDARAFRIVNPALAPPNYAKWIKMWTNLSVGY